MGHRLDVCALPTLQNGHFSMGQVWSHYIMQPSFLQSNWSTISLKTESQERKEILKKQKIKIKTD